MDFLKFANYKKLLQVKGNQVVLLQRKVSCAAKLLESLAYSSDNVDELKKLLETMNDVANDFNSIWRLSGRKLSIMVPLIGVIKLSLEDRGRWQYLNSLFCASIPLFVSTAP